MLIIKNWAAKFAFVLLVAGGLGGCMPKESRALLKGKDLIDEGRFEEAVEQLQVATSLVETNATAWNHLGLAYHHTGASTNAEQAYLRALSLDRNLSEAHYNLGVLRLEQNRLDAARASLITHTALQANSLDGWLKLATVQLRLRDLAAAEQSFEQALRLESANPEALNGLGMVYLQRRDARQAMQYFHRALDENSAYGPALLNLAVLNHLYLNNRAEALQKYREYLALPNRPGDWAEVNRIAQTLSEELNPTQQVAANTRARGVSQPQTVTTPPQPTRPAPASPRTNAPMPRTAPAPANSSSGNQAARTDAAPARQLPASNPPVQVVRVAPEPAVRAPEERQAPARPAPETSRPETVAAAQADEPVKTNRNGTGLLRQINPVRLFRKDPTNAAPRPAAGSRTAGPAAASAAAAYPRYRYQNPPKPSAGDTAAAEKLFLEGSRAHQENRLADAIQAYRKAIERNPAYFEAYYNMALASMSAGNLSQALTAFERALVIRPESLDARYNFALALKNGNYILDSMREFEAVLNRYPREARAHIALGNIHAQQLRQPLEARNHYTKALELDPRSPQAPAIRLWLSSH